MNPIPVYQQITLGDCIRRIDAGGFQFSASEHPAGLVLPLHAHAKACVCIIMEGGFLEGEGSQVHECVPGTVIAKHAGQHHWNRFADRPTRSMMIEFPEPQLEAIREFTPILDRGGPPQQGPAFQIASEIYREAHRNDSVSPLAIHGLTLELIAALARDRKLDPGRNDPQWLSKVREMILGTPDEHLSLTVLAREVGLHPVHLSRAFRRHAGCSVGEYSRRLRIDAASELLRTTKYPIADIAVQTGFADQAHLTRSFRRYLGTTPAAYRRASQ